MIRKVDTDNLEQLSFNELLDVYNKWRLEGGLIEYNWRIGLNDELYSELKELLKMITLEPKCLIELNQIDNVIQGWLNDGEYDIINLSRILISLIRLNFKSVVFNYNLNRRS